MYRSYGARLSVAVLGGAAIVSFAQFASATTPARADYDAAMDRASAVHTNANAKCEAFTLREKVMCVVEAKYVEKRAKAVAEASYQSAVRLECAQVRAALRSVR